MNNPTKNGACNWANRVKAEWKQFPQQLGKLLEAHVAATPGATMTSHVLHMTYAHGDATYDGTRRVERFDTPNKVDPNAWAFSNGLESY